MLQRNACLGSQVRVPALWNTSSKVAGSICTLVVISLKPVEKSQVSFILSTGCLYPRDGTLFATSVLDRTGYR